MALIFLLHGAIILLPFKGSPAYRTWLAILLLPGTMLLLFMGHHRNDDTDRRGEARSQRAS